MAGRYSNTKTNPNPFANIDEAGMGLLNILAGGLRGATTATLGAPGDLLGLLGVETNPLPTSDDMSAMLPSAGGSYEAGAMERMGQFLPIPAAAGAPRAARAAVPGINNMTEDFIRARANPVFGTEVAVTDPPFMRNLSGNLNNVSFNKAGQRVAERAQQSAGGPYANFPVEMGQGAWQGSQGLETNPLYMQKLPARAGRIDEDPELLRYVAQTSQNLNQDANGVNRFVRQAIGDPSRANAMMVDGLTPGDIRKLAEAGLTNDMVISAQPGGKALVMGFDDNFDVMDALARIKGVAPKAKPTYGKSNVGQDRVFMIKDGMGDWAPNYSQFTGGLLSE